MKRSLIIIAVILGAIPAAAMASSVKWKECPVHRTQNLSYVTTTSPGCGIVAELTPEFIAMTFAHSGQHATAHVTYSHRYYTLGCVSLYYGEAVECSYRNTPWIKYLYDSAPASHEG